MEPRKSGSGQHGDGESQLFATPLAYSKLPQFTGSASASGPHISRGSSAGAAHDSRTTDHHDSDDDRGQRGEGHAHPSTDRAAPTTSRRPRSWRLPSRRPRSVLASAGGRDSADARCVAGYPAAVVAVVLVIAALAPIAVLGTVLLTPSRRRRCRRRPWSARSSRTSTRSRTVTSRRCAASPAVRRATAMASTTTGRGRRPTSGGRSQAAPGGRQHRRGGHQRGPRRSQRHDVHGLRAADPVAGSAGGHGPVLAVQLPGRLDDALGHRRLGHAEAPLYVLLVVAAPRWTGHDSGQAAALRVSDRLRQATVTRRGVLAQCPHSSHPR